MADPVRVDEDRRDNDFTARRRRRLPRRATARCSGARAPAAISRLHALSRLPAFLFLLSATMLLLLPSQVAAHPRATPPIDSGAPESNVEGTDAASPATFAWERLVVVPAPTFVAGDVGTVIVELRNAGTVTWDSTAHDDFLSYHLWTGDGRLLVRDGIRTPFARPVPPGETIRVELQVRAPHRPGAVLLDVLPVREHVRWYPLPTRDRTGFVELPLEVADLAWDLEYEETPAQLAIDGHAMVSIRIHNTGFDTWGERDFLSYHWLTRSGEVVAEGPRTPFPAQIHPGQTATVLARIEPPAHRGDFFLRWQPVRENVKWFGPAPEHANAIVPITVVPPELAWRLADIETLPAVWVNRSFRVRVTLQNMGTATWSEDSGDHLAYHWLDENDGVVKLDGRRSSYPHDVAPGDTIVVSALVSGPPVTGSYKLQWEPVREHVRWFGPPTRGPRTLLIETRRLSTWLQLAIASIGLSAVVWIRRRRPQLARSSYLQAFPVVWAFAALVLVSVTFSEVASLEMWKRALTYTLSGAAGLVAPLVLLHGRVRMAVAALVVALANALAFSDLVYMHFFGAIVPVTALTAAHQAGELGASIAELVEASYAWLLPVPLAGIAQAWLWPRSEAGQIAQSRGWRWHRAGAWVLPIACIVGTWPVSGRLQRAMGGKLGKRVYSEARNVSRLGVLNAHIFDVARTLSEATTRDELPDDQLAAIAAYYAARADDTGTKLASAPDFGLAKGANLVLIQVEAAQGFIVEAEVDGQPIAPFMRSLVDRGLAFPNVFDQTNHGKTSDSEYLTLTSNHPLKAGALAFLRASNHFVTLAHVLRERGYETLSAHPYKRGFWNRAVLHPRYGFQRSLFRRELGPGQDVGWGLADGLFFQRLLPELVEMPRPFFAFLVTLSLHHPYDSFPDNLKELELGALENTNLGNYLHGMNYFDRSLEQFFRDLAVNGLLESTIVALYGDHDARLPYDADLRRLVGVERWSPSLEQRLERIPLFVVLPDNARKGVVETTGGQIDIGPTLLHYLGVPRPSSFLGQPLLATLHHRVVAYPEGSAFTDDRMFVATGFDIPRHGGCFHLPSGKSRALTDCRAIRQFAKTELQFSRLVLDHDLQRHLQPVADEAITISPGDP